MCNIANPDFERAKLYTSSNLALKMESGLKMFPVTIRLHFEHKLLTACLKHSRCDFFIPDAVNHLLKIGNCDGDSLGGQGILHHFFLLQIDRHFCFSKSRYRSFKKCYQAV